MPDETDQFSKRNARCIPPRLIAMTYSLERVHVNEPAFVMLSCSTELPVSRAAERTIIFNDRRSPAAGVAAVSGGRWRLWFLPEGEGGGTKPPHWRCKTCRRQQRHSGQPVQACGGSRPKTKNQKSPLNFFSFAHVKKLNVMRCWMSFFAAVLLAAFLGYFITETLNNFVLK